MTEQQQDNTMGAGEESGMPALLGVVVGNFVVWKLASGGVLRVFPGLAADPLDRGMIGAVLIPFIVLLNWSPDGRSGWIRFLVAVLLADAVVVLICALAALLAVAIRPADSYEYTVGFLEWGQLVVLFVTFFPLVSGLARIGLLPGFRWGRDTAAGPEAMQDEPHGAAPAWWPPRFAHLLLGLVVLFGLMTMGPDGFGRLAAAWPGSILPAMDPTETVILIGMGGMVGFAACIRQRWYVSLAAVVLGAGIMGLVAVAFALSLPVWEWLGLGAQTSQAIADIAPILVTVAVALYLFYRLLDRESRRDGGEPAADTDEAATGESRP